MSPCKKAFLLIVGVVTIAFDEFSKSIEEASQSIEEGRKKINKRIPKSQVQMKPNRR